MPWSTPVGMARRPASPRASITWSGVRVVAMSMSSMGLPIRVLRTQPPTNRAQPAKPPASRAAITACVSGSAIHGATPIVSVLTLSPTVRNTPRARGEAFQTIIAGGQAR